MFQKLKLTFYGRKSCLQLGLVYIFLIAAGVAGDDPVYNLAEYLYKQGNYQAAIIEYNRYLFFHPDADQTDTIYFKMGQACNSEEQYEKAIMYLDKAALGAKEARDRDSYRIEQSLILMKNENYDLAKLKLLKLIHFSEYDFIRKKAEYFLGLCFAMQYNWNESLIHFRNYFSKINPASYVALDSLYRLHDSFSYKSPSSAKWLSTFIPGSGQIYAEDFRNGFNALAVNFSFGYLIVYGLAKGQILDVLIIYATLFERYYSGNRYHAEETAREYNLKLDKKFHKMVTEFLYQQVE